MEPLINNGPQRELVALSQCYYHRNPPAPTQLPTLRTPLHVVYYFRTGL